MDNINLNIGKKLNFLRKKKGYSLSKLQEISGVSKSMLGQIERGESNPTVKILWKIAKSLNVSFSFFVDEDNVMMSKTSSSNILPIIEEKNKYRVYPLITFDERKSFEIYMIEIEAGYSYESEPHSTGVEEYVMLIQGSLEISVEENMLTAAKEEIIHFKGDCAHTYHSKSDFTAKAYILIYYS